LAFYLPLNRGRLKGTMAAFLEPIQVQQLVEQAFFWRRKPKLYAPDGATRLRAVSELLEALEGPDGADAATMLATIGHPRAVRWLLERTNERACAQWSVQLLECVLADFSASMEFESLCALADLADPLQTIAEPPTNWAGKKLPACWENYRSVDCSALRQKAETELQRRIAIEQERDQAAAVEAELQSQASPDSHQVA